jgi:hypothetical protein
MINTWLCWFEESPHQTRKEVNSSSAKDAAELFALNHDSSNHFNAAANGDELIVVVLGKGLNPQRFAVVCVLNPEYHGRRLS